MDNQEIRVFTKKSEADKAINTLKGILKGISIDDNVNDEEIKELIKWSEQYYELIEKNPFREFILTIQNTIENEGDKNESIKDLYWLSQKYDQENVYYNAVTADLQELQGICHGILSDGIINDNEIYQLEKWINEQNHLSSYYPYDELKSLLLLILKDGKIDDSERLLLKAYFKQFVKLSDNELTQKIDTEIKETNISGLCSFDPNIIIVDNTFCITGNLQRGSRSDLVKSIENAGGKVVSSPSKKTDYLIVGDSGNPAWAFSCYGRKVEKALQLRKDGHNITIVHEFDFSDVIDDL